MNDKNEKLSLLKELVKLANSDKNVKQAEYNFLSAIAIQLEITPQEFVKVFEENILFQPPKLEGDRILQFQRLILLMHVDQSVDEEQLRIVRELGNENIDVINYTKNEQLFISRALSPAKVVSMEIEEYEEEKNGKKGRVNVFLKPEEVSKAIGKGGVNIRLASELTKYDIDVQREGLEEEDVELTEFRDEIEPWVIQEFKNIGLDTAKSVLDASVEELLKRTDLEEETILDVQRILKEEFEE